MKIAEVTKREAELIELYDRAKEANALYLERCEFVATQAITTPTVIQRYISAVANDKENVVAHETEQLALLFNAMPTVQGQVAA